jgi:hypothetical protein
VKIATHNVWNKNERPFLLVKSVKLSTPSLRSGENRKTKEEEKIKTIPR